MRRRRPLLVRLLALMLVTPACTSVAGEQPRGASTGVPPSERTVLRGLLAVGAQLG